MKRILILTLIVLGFGRAYQSIAQNKEALKVKEINYGPSFAQKLYADKMKKSPSGNHNITTEKLIINKTTDTVQAVVGAQFGIEYELISKKNEIVDIEITWLFPDGMSDLKGKKIKKLTYTTPKETNSYTYSNYTLEGENEVVKGEWVFIISKGGKELYRRKFILI